MSTIHAEQVLGRAGPPASRGLRLAALGSTGAFAAAMCVSGALYLIGPRPLMDALHGLGYPTYFLKLLGAAKLLGAVALFAPPRSPLREWAYAGFGFDLAFAIASHLATGSATDAVAPFVALALLASSYALRRRVPTR